VAGRVALIIAAEAGLAVPRAGALGAAIVGMAEGAAGWWLDEHRPLAAGELADELTGLAWKGFARFPAGTREPDVPADHP
jgi:hypothetical protein